MYPDKTIWPGALTVIILDIATVQTDINTVSTYILSGRSGHLSRQVSATYPFIHREEQTTSSTELIN